VGERGFLQVVRSSLFLICVRFGRERTDLVNRRFDNPGQKLSGRVYL
jgi:hypothetical protein